MIQPTRLSLAGRVWVSAYIRLNGQQVRGHWRRVKQ